MPANREFWCICRKYCKGRRRQLNTANTWRSHLREADEDEKDTIRLAGLSDEFRAFLSAASKSNAGIKRPADVNLDDDDDSRLPPAQQNRLPEQGSNSGLSELSDHSRSATKRAKHELLSTEPQFVASSSSSPIVSPIIIPAVIPIISDSVASATPPAPTSVSATNLVSQEVEEQVLVSDLHSDNLSTSALDASTPAPVNMDDSDSRSIPAPIAIEGVPTQPRPKLVVQNT